MGIKIPKQMGGFTVERGGQQAQLKILERRTAITAVCKPLTSMWFAKAFSRCPFRDNDLPGRYKCTDNHTQTSVAVVEVTPSFHKFLHEYLTGV